MSSPSRRRSNLPPVRARRRPARRRAPTASTQRERSVNSTGGDHEHRAVVRQDRARPDRVEHQPDDVQHEPAPRRASTAAPHGGAGRRSTLRVSSVTPTPATSTNVAANRVDSGPVHGSKNWSISVRRRARPPRRIEVAVEVHDDDADQRDGAHDVGPGQAAGRRAERRGAPWLDRSSPHHLVDDRGDQRALDVDRRRRRRAPSRRPGRAPSTCACAAARAARGAGAAKWNGLRPSASGCDAVGGAGADHDERRRRTGRRAAGTRPACRPAPGARRARRRRGGAPSCRRATARCRAGCGTGGPATRRAAPSYASVRHVADPHLVAGDRAPPASVAISSRCSSSVPASGGWTLKPTISRSARRTAAASAPRARRASRRSAASTMPA